MKHFDSSRYKAGNVRLSIGFLLAICTMRTLSVSAATYSPARFNEEGELMKPEGYRQWVHIGTQVTPNELNGGHATVPEFHSVYIDPKSFKHWKKTGEFRDGTMIVKELISVGATKALTGNGYFMGEYIGLEAAVKSSERFPNEPGHWAYFVFGMEYPLSETAAAKPTAQCNACHQANAKHGWVFTQYYPVLRAAKPEK